MSENNIANDTVMYGSNTMQGDAVQNNTASGFANEVIDEDFADTGDMSVATPVLQKDDNLNTSIATVGTSASLQLVPSFDNVLKQIPIQLSVIDGLLDEYRADSDAFFDKYDEDEIDTQLKTLRDLSAFTKNIDGAKADIRRYLDRWKKEVMQTIDAKLNEADFERLKIAEADIKALKNDLMEHRKNQRWLEVKEVFDMAFDTVEGQSVKQFLPRLADFNLFKENHSNLVSGAKTKPVKKTDKAYVRDLINSYSQGLALIQQNAWGLNDKYLAKLMESFGLNPDYMGLNQKGIGLAAEQVAEEQREFERRKREEEERKRQEELRRLAEENARKLQESKKIAPTVKPVVKEEPKKTPSPQPAPVVEPPKPKNDFSHRIPQATRQQFSIVIPYIENSDRFNNLHTNPDQKAALIWECMTSLMDANSIFSKEFSRDSVKTLAFVRFVLDI